MTKVFHFLLLVFLSQQILAQNSLNQINLEITSPDTFSFLVGGHFYGNGKNRTKLPAASILLSIDTINKSDASFVVSLGDLFNDVRNDIPFTKKHFLNRLEIPIYNAVGDHDISGSVYSDEFGETYFDFEIGKNKFIVLDTELNDSHIKGDQLDFLKNSLSEDIDEIENIFLFSHRPIWAEEDPALQSLFKNNTKGTFGTNFRKVVEPLINNLMNDKNVYWFGGSTGHPVASYFYYQPKSQLHYIQTTIGNKVQDGLIKVQIENGNVSFETMPLIEDSHLQLTEYNSQYWKSKRGLNEPITMRQRLGRAYLFMTDYRFITGLISGFLLLFGFRFLNQKL